MWNPPWRHSPWNCIAIRCPPCFHCNGQRFHWKNHHGCHEGSNYNEVHFPHNLKPAWFFVQQNVFYGRYVLKVSGWQFLGQFIMNNIGFWLKTKSCQAYTVSIIEYLTAYDRDFWKHQIGTVNNSSSLRPIGSFLFWCDWSKTLLLQCSCLQFVSGPLKIRASSLIILGLIFDNWK